MSDNTCPACGTRVSVIGRFLGDVWSHAENDRTCMRIQRDAARAERDKAKVDASNHAAEAETARRERDAADAELATERARGDRAVALLREARAASDVQEFAPGHKLAGCRFETALLPDELCDRIDDFFAEEARRSASPQPPT